MNNLRSIQYPPECKCHLTPDRTAVTRNLLVFSAGAVHTSRVIVGLTVEVSLKVGARETSEQSRTHPPLAKDPTRCPASMLGSSQPTRAPSPDHLLPPSGHPWHLHSHADTMRGGKQDMRKDWGLVKRSVENERGRESRVGKRKWARGESLKYLLLEKARKILSTPYANFKIKWMRDGKMTPWLLALAVVADDPGLIPSTIW